MSIPTEQLKSPKTQTEASPAGKMLLGAEAIAEFLYGRSDEKTVRDVYRNIASLTFFHHGNCLAAFTDTLVSELREHEHQARQERLQKKEEKAQPVVRRQRRASEATA